MAARISNDTAYTVIAVSAGTVLAKWFGQVAVSVSTIAAMAAVALLAKREGYRGGAWVFGGLAALLVVTDLARLVVPS